MQIFHMNIPAGIYVGTANEHTRIEEDSIYYVVASGLKRAQDALIDHIGPQGCRSFSFATETFDVAAIFTEQAAKQAEHRENGYVTDEEKQISRLLRKTARDLGSIAIDGAIFVISNEGKQVINARIEAREATRERVIFLQDERSPLANLKSEAVVRAIEAKF